MRVVYFGTYSTAEGYPRNRVLIEGLRRAGVDVTEVHEEFWADAADKISGATGWVGGLQTALRYLRAWGRLAWRYSRTPRADAIVVGYTGQVDVFLARLLAAFTGRPVVLDAFLSLHDTLVEDRGLVRAGSAKARLLAWLDRTSCRLADLVLLDTDEHARWFARFTRLPERRFATLFVGEDDREFPAADDPGREAGEPLRVLWFGTYVPLQGVDVVLGAASRLAGRPVTIRMAGRGQQLETFRAKADALPNVELIPRWLSYDELREEIRAAHVCLGVFGTTAKARRVIPCKVYDALASRRPVVTADSPAARELLEHERSAVLVPPGEPEALADALLALAADEPMRRRIGEAGYARFRERASPEVLGREFRDLLENPRVRS